MPYCNREAFPVLLRCLVLVYLLTCMLSHVVLGKEAGTEVLLKNPKELETVMTGKPESTWVVSRTKEVEAEPRAVYRCSGEIKLRTLSGHVQLNVRQITEAGESIVFSPVAKLEPQVLDYATYTGTFIGDKNMARLQVYLRLNRVDGKVAIRNVVLEKLSEKEAAKVLEKMKVPAAYLSLPVYCYSDDKVVDFGYELNGLYNRDAKKITAIRFSCPEIKFSVDVAPEGEGPRVSSMEVSFPEGSYTVRGEALDEKGTVIVAAQSRMRSIKRPQRKNYIPVKTVELDSKRNLKVNGELCFPVGLYHLYTGKQLKQISDQGFNSAQIWDHDPQNFKDDMDRAAENNILSLTVTKMVDDKKMKELVSLLKNHPANLLWDLVDEPSMRDILPKQVRPKADLLKKLDPERPVRISFANTAKAAEYKGCMDIVSTHYYPIPFGNVKDVSVRMSQLAKEFSDSASVQFTPQCWKNWNDPGGKVQTYEETRAMTYLAIINGAKGLCYYSFYDTGTWDVRLHPQLWSSFKGLNWELQELAPAFLDGKRMTSVTCSAPEIEYAAWKSGDEICLIAVNTVKDTVSAGISIKGYKELVTEETFGLDPEGTFVAANGFEKTFSPLQTRIFRITTD